MGDRAGKFALSAADASFRVDEDGFHGTLAWLPAPFVSAFSFENMFASRCSINNREMYLGRVDVRQSECPFAVGIAVGLAVRQGDKPAATAVKMTP